MARKNQLEDRIATLEAEVAFLRSQLATAYPYWSVLPPTNPERQWKITQGDRSVADNRTQHYANVPERLVGVPGDVKVYGSAALFRLGAGI